MGSEASERKPISKVKIAPSILASDLRRLEEEVKKVDEAGADMIHVDVMDGHFVPNITVGPQLVEALRGCTRLPLDVHLMIEEPEKYVESFRRAGADIITVHVEVCRHLQRLLQFIRDLGAKPGVVLNPLTPLIYAEEALSDVDMVLLMSVNPGFGGQQFLPGVLPRVSRLKEAISRGGFNVEVQVDGGIKVSNAAKVIEAGADILVAGTAVFSSGDYAGTIKLLKGGSKG